MLRALDTRIRSLFPGLAHPSMSRHRHRPPDISCTRFPLHRTVARAYILIRPEARLGIPSPRFGTSSPTGLSPAPPRPPVRGRRTRVDQSVICSFWNDASVASRARDSPLPCMVARELHRNAQRIAASDIQYLAHKRAHVPTPVAARVHVAW